MPHRETRASELAIPLCLTACFLLLATRFMGISFGDDSFYLWAGKDIQPSALFGSQDWSPLYCLWFKLIGYIVHDPLAGYFASWGILVAVAALLPALIGIRSAWLYAFVILCIPFLKADPFVGLFAGVIMLLGTCLVLRRDRSVTGVLTTACVYLCAGLTLLSLPMSPSLQRLFKTTEESQPSRSATSVVVVTVLALSAIIFVVFTRAHSTRAGMAFAQHYNRRAADRGLIPNSINVWASDYAEKSFGIDKNLLDPKTLFLLGITVALVAWPWISLSRRHLRLVSLWIAILCLPPLIEIIVIYPRDHYAILLLPSLLLYATQLVPTVRWSMPSALGVAGLGCCLIGLLNIGLPRLRHAPVTKERTDLFRAECIRRADQMADANNPNVFDTSSIPGIYLLYPRTVTHPSDLTDWPQFAAWVSANHPAWISLEPYSAAPYYRSPAEVEDLLSRKLGYTAHPCKSNAFLTLYTRDTR
jgi:hypothetical protein